MPLKAQAGDGRFAVLINNLGGVSALEMALLTKELAHSALKENIAYLIGPAPLVSALDMKGFSLTLLKLNDSSRRRFTPRSRRWAGRSPSRSRPCVPSPIAPFMIAWNIPVGQSAGERGRRLGNENIDPAGKSP
nr:dihydroxyacetone kinase subunit DhaK [Enterobacter hormaechei]